jgi:NAD(P)H-dependent flavin oxidoreductase YrpB (nitropropane dioxygenase family)
MSLRTPLCELLGITVPVVQAPIGSASGPALAAAVCKAGALGMVSLTWTPPRRIPGMLAEIRSQTDRPFGVNLVLGFPIEDKLALCLDAGVPVISTFWGDPSPYVARIHAAGALHLHTVACAAEARAAGDAGIDVVVAQGWEAGGHLWGSVASLPLVPAVVDTVAPTPVIAAGGIADGRGLAAILALGAQAAWIGTRFLAATEANVHDEYQQQVLAASETDALYTTAFDGGWPGAPHRALRNSTLLTWQEAGSPAAPDRPGEDDVIAFRANGAAELRYGDALPLPGMTGNLEAMAHYAGQSAGLVRDVAPAATIVADLVAGAEQVLCRFGQG